MRGWLVVIALLAGCKGHKDKQPPGAAAAATSGLAAPKVTVATVLAKETPAPPILLFVDDLEHVRVGAAASWADLDAQKVKISKRSGPVVELDKRVRENFALGRPPLDLVTSWEANKDDLDLESLEDTKVMGGANQDDPPPPEEEDKPDDGADESGGTGTAMALDEGKMGKKDADRAEGQYRMAKNEEDPQLARQQAIEQARNAGILGAKVLRGGGVPFASLDDHLNGDGTPSRRAQVEGGVMPDGKFERLRAMILVAPTAKAKTLIDAIEETSGAIAVSHDGKVRPLNLDFDVRDAGWSSSEYWLEVRLSAKGLVVEAVPDKPIEVAKLEDLGAAIAKARETRGAETDAPVDVLVDPDIDAQRMIDVVVALEASGEHAIGLGAMPSAEELARRGHRIPTIHVGQPNAQGDLDKKEIRKVIKANMEKISACYTTALAGNPALTGTVAAQFFITPTGTVSSASATGVDPAVSDCIAGVLQKAVFPKPKGGGGVQVFYPFTMKP